MTTAAGFGQTQQVRGQRGDSSPLPLHTTPVQVSGLRLLVHPTLPLLRMWQVQATPGAGETSTEAHPDLSQSDKAYIYKNNEQVTIAHQDFFLLHRQPPVHRGSHGADANGTMAGRAHVPVCGSAPSPCTPICVPGNPRRKSQRSGLCSRVVDTVPEILCCS